jgi:hypothetical protein
MTTPLEFVVFRSAIALSVPPEMQLFVAKDPKLQKSGENDILFNIEGKKERRFQLQKSAWG